MTPASGSPSFAPADITPANTQRTQESLVKLVRFFESVSPHTLSDITRHYAPEATFKDPFNDVMGTSEMIAIFERMFKNVKEPRFIVHEQMAQGVQAFLTWDMTYRFPTDPADRVRCIRGASHLHFNHQGLVVMHRDYWDAAEELYEQLPVLGSFMRWLKRRVG